MDLSRFPAQNITSCSRLRGLDQAIVRRLFQITAEMEIASMLVSTKFALATVLALAPLSHLNLTAQGQSPRAALGLVGAWSVTVTLTDCNGTVKGTFPSIVMFSRGGTVTETTFNPAFQPGQRSTGLGVWWLNDRGTYGASDVAFIQFSAGMFTAGTQEINHVITLNRSASKWTDLATVQFYDSAHDELAHACAVATAVRLQ